MAILAPTTTTPTTTKSKNTNAVYYDPAAQDQFTAAAQAQNPTYQPDTFDINKYMFDQGVEYGWQDPLAAEIFTEYAGKTPYTTKSSDYWLEQATPYEGSGSEASYKSPLDPRNWGRTFGGDVMDEMAAEYEKRAITPSSALTPEEQATAGGGSLFSVAPEVGGEEELTKKLMGMWAPQTIK